MDAAPQADQYRVIYADPPWRFATYSDKGKGRSAEAHYDCLTIDQIKAIPVGRWAADDAVLLLWATDPLLPRALEVIEAWGFTYKTVGFYWVKLNKSMARTTMAVETSMQALEVLGEAAVAGQPGEAALDHPAPRQHLEALRRRRSLDDLQA